MTEVKMETLQRANERKIEKERHNDCLETDVREEARKNFKRQPYQTVSVAHAVYSTEVRNWRG